jgi:Tfp pilus assembly protein PilP
MKLTTALLAVGWMTGGLWAQNPNVIQSVQNNMNAVQQQKTNDSNAALGIKNAPASAQATKPAPGAPAKAANPATTAVAKPAPAAKPASVTAPAKVQAAQSTSKTSPAAPKSAVVVKTVSSQQRAKPVVVTQSTTKAGLKPAEKISVAVGVRAHAKPGAKATANTAVQPFAASAKPSDKKTEKTVISAAPTTPVKAAPAEATPTEAVTAEAPKPPKPEEKKWAMNGKRDPFFSPVVQQPTGSGCSTGKKCLEIGQINLHGVVKSDSGFIAVVTNNLGKAYFLRENDPVFNGYVVRITGDTVVFQETYTDQLGKPLTREVVKRITTPAV